MMAEFARRLLLLAPLPALAQTAPFPTRALTLTVPFAPGGPVDNVARPVAEVLRRQLGQPVIVENRPGAGGVLGSRAVAAARPDGYSLLVGSAGPLVIAPAANPEAPPIDLAPVALISDSPQMLVVPMTLPVTDLAGFIALARARPGALNIASAGIGTTPHLAAELFQDLAGIRLEHVPYRGTGAALPDLVGGKVEAAFGDISAVLPLVESGRLRALAITARERSPLAPGVPTSGEGGYPTLISRNWQALLAPAGTPGPVLDRLAEALAAAGQDEAFRAALARQGVAPIASSPSLLRDYIAAERAIWGPVIGRVGLRLE